MDAPEKPSQTTKSDEAVVDVEGHTVENDPAQADPASWRTEMSKRFDTESRSGADPAIDREREVFERKLEHLERPDADAPEWRQGPTAVPFPPVSRDPSLHPAQARPQQRRLTLDPPPPEFIPPSYENEPPEEDFASIPREVIISRVLAGLVDLLIPVVLGLVFVFSATWFTGLDFFSAAATRWWVIFSVILFVQGSIFFLWASGQTPGMYLTELRVIDARNREPGMLTTVVRVLLFLVSLVTVVGLLLAVFDPQCRALHDRLTGTKVIPEAGLPE